MMSNLDNFMKTSEEKLAMNLFYDNSECENRNMYHKHTFTHIFVSMQVYIDEYGALYVFCIIRAAKYRQMRMVICLSQLL